MTFKILTIECDAQFDLVFRFGFSLVKLVRKKNRAIRLHNFTRNGIIWHFRVFLFWCYNQTKRIFLLSFGLVMAIKCILNCILNVFLSGIQFYAYFFILCNILIHLRVIKRRSYFLVLFNAYLTKSGHILCGKPQYSYSTAHKL